MKTCKLGLDRSCRTGLFGGTFNPIHRGHIQAAGDVLHAFKLDRIYFIPSALPPHKSSRKLASAADRLQMVRLALKGHERFEACDIETERNGPSYSIDTVRHFKSAGGGRTVLYFIMGVDAFLEIHMWKDFNRLFEHTAMVVMSRPGAGQWTPPVRRQVESYVKRHIDPGYQPDPGETKLDHLHLCAIHLVSVTPVDVSSSLVRDRIAKGDSIKDLVPPSVAEYILQRRLLNER
jgi:nicotinate-nucleotide adenylyltransferase